MKAYRIFFTKVTIEEFQVDVKNTDDISAEMQARAMLDENPERYQLPNRNYMYIVTDRREI